MPESATIQAAADRLRQAEASRTPCLPIRDLIEAGDVTSAYAAQEINTQSGIARGRRLVGRKIGLTSKAVQAQLGVDQPDFGMLFADMQVDGGKEIAFAALMQPRIEAEVALVLSKPLARQRHTLADLIDATDYAIAALEIVGSRIAKWDIKIADTIADNASSSHFVLGSRHMKLTDLDLVNCKMTMIRRGQEVSAGTGAACLGNPLIAATWLADTMVAMGRPLDAGDVVLSGALGPMVTVEPGDLFEARIDGLGDVSARFGAT